MATNEVSLDIKKVRLNDNDVGSTAVQVVMLTHRIRHITEHLKSNHKDVHSRHGLLNMVSKRKRLLAYLKRTDVERYMSVVKLLGLRHG